MFPARSLTHRLKAKIMIDKKKEIGGVRGVFLSLRREKSKVSTFHQR